MSHHKLVFIGFGNVARALARLLLRKGAVLEREHSITFSVTGIATGRHGSAVDPNGLDLESALSLVGNGNSLAGISGSQPPPCQFPRGDPALGGGFHVREFSRQL